MSYTREQPAKHGTQILTRADAEKMSGGVVVCMLEREDSGDGFIMPSEGYEFSSYHHIVAIPDFRVMDAWKEGNTCYILVRSIGGGWVPPWPGYDVNNLSIFGIGGPWTLTGVWSFPTGWGGES